jgi:hypothetical protein
MMDFMLLINFPVIPGVFRKNCHWPSNIRNTLLCECVEPAARGSGAADLSLLEGNANLCLSAGNAVLH